MKSRLTRKTLIAISALLFVSGVFARANAQDGPEVGETVDLLSFRSRSGKTLADVFKHKSLAMLVLVDPSCSACTSTKESMEALRVRVQKNSIGYAVIMIPTDVDTQKYFDFADSLKLGTEAYVWSNMDVKPPAPLIMMAKPSHLQITGEGLIVKKWLGTPAKDSEP